MRRLCGAAIWNLLRAAFWLVATYGVYAAAAQRIVAKLLLEHGSFWGEAPSFWSFAIDYLAIATACVAVTQLFMRNLQRNVAGAAGRNEGSLGFRMKEEV